MLRCALLGVLLAGCGAASPCIGATAAGERYCAIACGSRERIACPTELPHRTDAPGVAVCRAEEGPLAPAICAQLPNGCEVATEAPPIDAWRAAIEETGAELHECEGGEHALRWSGPRTTDLASVPPGVMEIEGVTSAGRGGCCGMPDEGEAPICLVVWYRRAATDPARIARALAALRAEDEGLAARLVPTGMSAPRCSSESPFCLPEAYEGCAATTYRPEAARHRLDMGTSSGACEHDGECVQAGCGNDCVAWESAGGPGTCEGYTYAFPVYCGCVEGACAWFAQ